MQKNKLLFTFFKDSSYPPDADTNALIYSILYDKKMIDKSSADNLLDIIQKYMKNGIVQVWLSNNRKNNFDFVVCTNVLYLSYLLHRSEEFSETEKYVISILESGEYIKGSRYYHKVSSFFYFISRLIRRFLDFRRKYSSLFRTALENINPKGILDESMYLISLKCLGFNDIYLEKVIYKKQLKDGSWPIDSFFKYGSKKQYFGSKAISTAFALKSLL